MGELISFISSSFRDQCPSQPSVQCLIHACIYMHVCMHVCVCVLIDFFPEEMLNLAASRLSCPHSAFCVLTHIVPRTPKSGGHSCQCHLRDGRDGATKTEWPVHDVRASWRLSWFILGRLGCDLLSHRSAGNQDKGFLQKQSGLGLQISIWGGGSESTT